MALPAEMQRARALAFEFMSGRITRRELMVRAAALGVCLPVLGAALSTPVFLQSVGAQGGGELIAAASQDIDTLDPHISQFLFYNHMMRLTCFNSLVRPTLTLDREPDLAEKWENPDDKTYVFTLREGIKYHTGQDVEASHVEFSLKRIVDLKTVLANRVANVETIEVVDKKTIKVVLETIQADFLDGLFPVSIISPEIAETIATTPAGTGPFKFVEWIQNDHITLERNPDYFEAGVPGVDKVTFRIITEPQVAITNLQAGGVNAVVDLPVAQAVPLKGSADVVPVIVPTGQIHLFEMIGLNSDPIRTNIKVRQALAHCLDKDTIQQTVFSGEGQQKWAFATTGSWAYKDVPGYPYDPEKARALLAEAGLEGLEFTCNLLQGWPDGEKIATIWQAGLAEAGIKMKLDVQSSSVWLDNYLKHTYDVTWNAFPGFADPNYFVSLDLQPQFQFGWDNAEAQQLGADANATLDQTKRTELYGRLQEICVAELPIIIVQETPVASLTAPNVTGWEVNPLGNVIVKNVKVG